MEWDLSGPQGPAKELGGNRLGMKKKILVIQGVKARDFQKDGCSNPQAMIENNRSERGQHMKISATGAQREHLGLWDIENTR
jgi:hypothetical protein